MDEDAIESRRRHFVEFQMAGMFWLFLSLGVLLAGFGLYMLVDLSFDPTNSVVERQRTISARCLTSGMLVVGVLAMVRRAKRHWASRTIDPEFRAARHSVGRGNLAAKLVIAVVCLALSVGGHFVANAFEARVLPWNDYMLRSIGELVSIAFAVMFGVAIASFLWTLTLARSEWRTAL